MEKFHISMGAWQDRLDCRWKQLPASRKRRIVLYSFAGYVLITIAIVAQVIYEIGSARAGAEVEHISNPLARQLAAENEKLKIQQFKVQNNEGDKERKGNLHGK